MKNKELCKSYLKMPCIVCGSYNSVSGHHIRSKGSGGPDIKENLIPLCLNHHTEVHQIAMVAFCQKYSAVKWYILSNGWFYCSYRERFWNDEIYSE